MISFEKHLSSCFHGVIAFAILRDSVSTSLVSLGEVGNTAQVQCDDISEGKKP